MKVAINEYYGLVFEVKCIKEMDVKHRYNRSIDGEYIGIQVKEGCTKVKMYQVMFRVPENIVRYGIITAFCEVWPDGRYLASRWDPRYQSKEVMSQLKASY